MKTPERKFMVQFVVGEKKLGTVLADLNGVGKGLSSSLIEERDPDKNLPRGAFTNQLRHILSSGPMKRSVLMKQMENSGFSNTTFASTITRLLKTGEIKATGKGRNTTISLKR